MIDWEDILLSISIKARTVKTVGLVVMLLPTLWDLFKMGAMQIIEKGYIVIYIPGLLCMFLGGAIIFVADEIRKRV